ncbi:MAG: hypothetical protein EXR36_15160 [Betaproteobacteria bacterium]|nr:hypothetical protein [Betaproteobacteria bacterium]
MSVRPSRLRGIGYMMLAVFLFSGMDTLAKLVLKSYPLPGLIWARYAVHLVFMIVLAAPHRGMAIIILAGMLAVNWQRALRLAVGSSRKR